MEFLDPTDRLMLYVGRIVVTTHEISETFELGGAMKELEDFGEEFNRRRTAWHSTLKTAFNGFPSLTGRLRKCNDQLVQLQQLRDALVHGGPRMMHHEHEGFVECRLNPSRKRYREAALSHVRRTSPPEHKKNRLDWAKTLMDNKASDITISYPLKYIEQWSEDAKSVRSEVMALTAASQNVKIPGYPRN